MTPDAGARGVRMKLSGLLLAKAIVSVAFGLAFIAVPTQVLSLCGVELEPIGEVLARMIGACLTGIGLVCWCAKSFEAQARQAIALSLCIADTIGFAIMFIAQRSGLLNELGWIIVAFWFLFAAGLGYFRFFKPDVE